MSVIICILISFLIVIVLIYALYFMPLRKPEIGFKYVYVEEKGTVRELSRDEKGYLMEQFDPNDGNRPYIKFAYNSKTPNGEIKGFIERNRVPRNIEIITPKINILQWRMSWILIIKDLTNFEYQKNTLLNINNTNPYYSFGEFMCVYFNDLGLSEGYEKYIESSFISQEEYNSIATWHKLLSEYNSPNNDDYNNKDILNDEKWLNIINIGVKSIELLKPHLSTIEKSLFM